MGPLIILLGIVVGGVVLVINRLLTHRERLAEIEARRPQVTLQLPASTSLQDIALADALTEQIEEACKRKGIDADVTLE
ncbi:MAG: hypothetical protein KC636_35455 [Myxococcales bacterium]|nr:hypothetical protein [Myxococcales bacterium]